MIALARRERHSPAQEPRRLPLIQFRRQHSTALVVALKLAAALVAMAPAVAQTTRPAQEPALALQERLTGLLAAGDVAGAIAAAQAAVRAQPDDEAVRAEFAALHLALARDWIAVGRVEDAQTAVDAVLRVAPQHAAARRLAAALRQQRQRVAEASERLDRLLELELFDGALRLIHEIEASQAGDAGITDQQREAARRGTADDHYLARNFHEAVALYDELQLDDAADAGVRQRWLIALTLALSDTPRSAGGDIDAATLRARVREIAPHRGGDRLAHIIAGLLAERDGDLVTAGQEYARAAGEIWRLPPADRRRARVAELRQRAVADARALHQQTPTGRRGGFWSIALPDVWKQDRTDHFVVFARNALVAERVGAAAEFHLAELARWLDIALPARWTPRCEIRVHATQADLRAATGLRGIGHAVSHSRVQGDRVLSRAMHVFQADPWLLSSTLPHELVHVLLASDAPEAHLPLTIEEGLALHAEPPARQLMYRRRLPAAAPVLAVLLRRDELPADPEPFYAAAAALVATLLQQNDQPAQTSIATLRAAFASGVSDDWWRAFGWASAAEATAAWQRYYAFRRATPRILMLRKPHDESAPLEGRR
jgi:tetratricopeptide (TPR) repeat protein